MVYVNVSQNMAFVSKICCHLVARMHTDSKNVIQCVDFPLQLLTVLYTVSMFWPVLKISLSTKHGSKKGMQKLRKAIRIR